MGFQIGIKFIRYYLLIDMCYKNVARFLSKCYKSKYDRLILQKFYHKSLDNFRNHLKNYWINLILGLLEIRFAQYF